MIRLNLSLSRELTFLFWRIIPSLGYSAHFHNFNSSCSEVFCEKGVLKNLTIFTERQPCLSLNKAVSSNKAVACKPLSQKDSDASTFLGIWRNF